MLQIELVGTHQDPYNLSLATARTCYSKKGIITPEQAAQKPELRDQIASSTFKAGHHTVYQHATFIFAIQGITRHALWSFFHNHPYYNSEQQSQRYCKMTSQNVLIPQLQLDSSTTTYQDCISFQYEAYESLYRDLLPHVEREYYKIFLRRQGKSKYTSIIKKKAMEIARYVLPVGSTASLYHTISLLTLARYYRAMSRQLECSSEIRQVVTKMVELVCDLDSKLETFFTEEEYSQPQVELTKTCGSFDRYLDSCNVKLKSGTHESLDMMIEVGSDLGVDSEMLGYETLVRRSVDSHYNPLLSDTLNTTSMDTTSSVANHVNFTFAKTMSHSADSQNQRHRTSTRTVLHYTRNAIHSPDFITPVLIGSDSTLESKYKKSMTQIWENISEIVDAGEDPYLATYLTPNATRVRLYETTSLLNLIHKHKMRLCYNAQEEIWDISRQEANIVEDVIGVDNILVPPCVARRRAQVIPYCPEGDKYCGVPVWNLAREDYWRAI